MITNVLGNKVCKGKSFRIVLQIPLYQVSDHLLSLKGELRLFSGQLQRISGFIRHLGGGRASALVLVEVS